MIKKISFSAAFILLFVVVCMAADLVSGTWGGTISTQNGDMALTYNLKADGEKLTGNIVSDQGTLEIYDGKVSGDKLSFKISFNDFVIPHEGTVVGDTLKIKMTIQDNVIESKFIRKK